LELHKLGGKLFAQSYNGVGVFSGGKIRFKSRRKTHFLMHISMGVIHFKGMAIQNHPKSVHKRTST
jgi:hypothetical protein